MYHVVYLDRQDRVVVSSEETGAQVDELLKSEKVSDLVAIIKGVKIKHSYTLVLEEEKDA